ncbi:formimidoylglutamate deiminase [Komagataeibacter nataicola]|uniref:Formimidoylglutamate deiminase n=1 Tax=Komagataeibacter nataicola TaxID=265960 RepID=A0A9N7H217_9PROT|nr:formimidoylglutamate deiminase [Komagataeibacter nataicola]AQU88724.1 formimidoylglutamate deiminase [Komagataeibacter nataicola]PYD67262.1 formimidoylglutamate deiminase [Komagataeibacter nataicola]WEQ57023.1 formimidoylglutamate deiminase [Komagataeibacter nataicola]GBR16058.1 N-formimino-L-glutamate deiminase [Komagataeibacter nataicola NRIC 0616]
MSLSVQIQTIFAGQALLPEGWRDNVRLGFDASGHFTTIEADQQPAPDDRRVDIALPPMPSLHSHAFQRAMAGLTETRLDPADSFWSWREQMYRLAAVIDPATLRAIAAQLYMEMLKAGYTQVAEFHYLHCAPDGQPYAQPAEMPLAVIDAARHAGIGITMLPALYRHAGFGRPLAAEQKRFASSPEFLARIITDITTRHAGDPLVNAGIALHSLRAASGDDIREMLALMPGDMPVHIHIAEQMKEVDDCVAFLGRRPVAWLLDEMPVNERWCLVHATHMDQDETLRLARSGAVAGICPITEANLGDGFFPFMDYVDAGGRFGIGSDSNVLLNVAEELRTLEYGQRLISQKRCRALPSDQTGSIGGYLYAQALRGGTQACAHGGGQLAVGQRADLCTLAGSALSLPDLRGDTIMDSLVFARATLPVSDVLCGGQWVVREGHHIHEERIATEFSKAITTLRSDRSSLS